MNTQSQKVALITGASRGLGRNTAESLARKGVDAVITYHSRADEARTVVAAIEAQGRMAVALQLDSAAVGTFDRFAETLKSTSKDTWSRDQFDHLVNNAGISHHNAFDKVTEARAGQPVQHELQGRVLPYAEAPAAHHRRRADRQRLERPDALRHPGHQSLCVLEGRGGGVHPLSCQGAGSARHHCQRGRAWRHCHGLQRRHGAGQPGRQQACRRHAALGRVGVPDDIGPVIASLLSDDHHWVTGQRIEASGGMVL
jgi:NAD(P)-dependent dehydrogenase (short-subunit alcohol dehydrogenase family)